MITALYNRAQTRLEQRRRYNRLANEILSLTEREISDMRADRGQMMRDLHRQIYG